MITTFWRINAMPWILFNDRKFAQTLSVFSSLNNLCLISTSLDVLGKSGWYHTDINPVTFIHSYRRTYNINANLYQNILLKVQIDTWTGKEREPIGRLTKIKKGEREWIFYQIIGLHVICSFYVILNSNLLWRDIMWPA